MLLAILDIETGGDFKERDLNKNFIVEIGAVLWDTELKCPVDMLSVLIKGRNKICEEATEYNGITQEQINKYGINIIEAFKKLMPLIISADYIVAQNGFNFDKPILIKAARFVDINYSEDDYGVAQRILEKPWIDTLYDVDYPRNCKSRNLTYLCGFHGFCNPFSHRAVFDAVATGKILSMYDLDKIVENAKSPMVEAEWKRRFPKNGSKESLEFHKQKDFCSKHGFRWIPEEKRWVLITKQRSIPKDAVEVLGDFYKIKEYKHA